MGKINKEEQARREGMAYALSVARKSGIEALEEELRFRNALRFPVGANREACEEALNNIKMNVVDTVTILSAMTLMDEFDFTKEQIERYVDRFNLKADCIMSDFTTWNDQIEILREECGLNYIIRREEDFVDNKREKK